MYPFLKQVKMAVTNVGATIIGAMFLWMVYFNHLASQCADFQCMALRFGAGFAGISFGILVMSWLNPDKEKKN